MIHAERDIALKIRPSVRQSICPSVRLPNASIVCKGMNIIVTDFDILVSF